MASGDRKKMVDEILGPKDGESAPSDSGSSALSVIADELIDAVHSKDSDGVVAALRAAFEEFESQEDPEEDEG